VDRMRHISLAGLDVSRLGLGCMGMSAYYAGAGSDEPESIRTIHRALELGITFIDTAEIYGPFTNEELVGKAIQGRRPASATPTCHRWVARGSRRGDQPVPVAGRAAVVV
jgi:aryl-alcohol dehydrogenase-like predicted oxidoreductase